MNAPDLKRAERDVGSPQEAVGSPPAATSRHFAALDGLRGIAILVVMIYHFVIRIPHDSPTLLGSIAYRICASGWIGVELFFVLSGFLITGILLGTRGDGSYFRTFYARRGLRILPAYYGLLAFYFLVAPRLVPESSVALTIEPQKQAWFWLYMANWLFASEGGFFTRGGYLWSLSIEEQFYIVWPVVVSSVRPSVLKWLCLACCAGVWIGRPCLVAAGVAPTTIYTMTITHIDGLLLGAMLAIAYRNGEFEQLGRVLGWAAVASLVGIGVILLLTNGRFLFYDEPTAAWGLTFTAILSAFVLWQAVAGPNSFVAKRLWDNGVLRYMGDVSYGLYLVHVPLGAIVAKIFFGWSGGDLLGSQAAGAVAFVVLATTACLVAASASWFLFEKPILRLKAYFPYTGT